MKQRTKPKKRECPKCKKMVVRVPRHLEGVHGMDKTEAQLLSRGLGNSVWRCVICNMPRKTMIRHMQNQHKLTKEKAKKLIKRMPPPVVHGQLNEFATYLGSIRGGRKCQATINVHLCSIRAIVRALGSNDILAITTSDIDKLFSYGLPNISPSSKQVYLDSLEKLGKYFACKQIPCDIQDIRDELPTWRQAFAKEARERRFRNQALRATNPLTYNEVREALRVNNLPKKITESIDEQGCITDQSKQYMVLLFALSNPHRPSAIRNVTIEHINKSQQIENDRFAVTVDKHKTSATNGSTYMVFTEVEMNAIKWYSSKLTSGVYLFRQGITQIGSGALNALLMAARKKLGLFEGKRFCCNAIRRSFTTYVHAHNIDVEDDAALYMSHSKRTARAFYINDVAKRSVNAYNLVNGHVDVGNSIAQTGVVTEYIEDAGAKECYNEEIQTVNTSRAVINLRTFT